MRNRNSSKKYLGCVEISSKRNESGSNSNKISMIFSPFIKSRKYPSKLLKLPNKAFNKVTFLINRLIVLTQLFTITLQWNNGNDILLCQLLKSFITVISFIHQSISCLTPFKQSISLCDISGLPSRQQKVQRIA